MNKKSVGQPPIRICQFRWTLLTALLFSRTEGFSKQICIGDSSLMATITASNDKDTYVSLYISGFEHNLHVIVRWHMNTSSYEYMLDEYSGKFFRDEFGNIWIRNVQLSDEAKYIIAVESSNGTIRTYKVNLTVLVAPNTNCKPKIERLGIILYASLDNDDCGKPAASVYWFEHPGLYQESKNVARLQQGRESGTYLACVESPALSCTSVLKLSDYCSAFTIEEYRKDSEASNDGIQLVLFRLMILHGVSLGLTIVLILFASIVTISFRKKMCEAELQAPYLDLLKEISNLRKRGTRMVYKDHLETQMVIATDSF